MLPKLHAPMTKNFFFALLWLTGWASAFAQAEDPVLFTVADDPVRVNEFTYIYSKTNGEKADFSRASLEEYLDLYIKFKLKVRKARDMQLDTIPALKKELAKYRKQLADSYLVNKKVMQGLLEEAYERKKQDVALRHILFKVDAQAGPEKEAEALAKAEEAYREITQGKADFEAVAEARSEDPSSKSKGGSIGFQTALFPPGFYALETAAYTLPAGKVSEPIRTRAGYHLVQVDERRPARGEIEVAHILIRHDKEAPDRAKARIDSLYEGLENGARFEVLAREYSEDRRTAAQSGYLGFFGINRYQSSFEEAAFAIPSDGAYCRPVRTDAGWHIIKRISRRGIQPLSVVQSRLETQIRRDPRFEEAVDAMVADIQEQVGLVEYPEVLETFKGTLNDTFLTFRWQTPDPPSQKTLFELGSRKVSLGAFTDYLGKITRDRIRKKSVMEVEEAADFFYREFLKDEILRYEESKLEEKYPDFKNLMREYDEGILLFEATKMLVWDKAAEDSTGLANFFEAHREDYRWDKRARITEYQLANEARNRLPELLKYAAEREPEEVLAAFNSEDKIVLMMDQRIVEKGKGNMPKNLQWVPGAMSPPENLSQVRKQRFYKVEEVMDPRPKTLDEARGYVIADYQDHLEAEWVEQLREEYPVEVNQKTLESIVKN